jgi:hypothetical protein
MTGKLLERLLMVRDRMSTACDRMSKWVMVAARSSSLFGNGTTGVYVVAAGHEVCGRVDGPAATPEHGQDLSIVKQDKVDTSKANTGGAAGAVSDRGCIQDNLHYPFFAPAHGLYDPGEILQEGVSVDCELHPMPITGL